MSVILPPYLANERRQPSFPIFGVYYGLQDITGSRATIADLNQVLASLRRSDVIQWITRILAWTSDPNSLNPPNQVAMAKTLLSEDLLRALQEAVEKNATPIWCAFHRRQLWFLLQMTVL